MTNPTRQEMLSAIEHKIARTSPTETPNIVKVNPVMIGDWLDYIDNNNIHEKVASSYPRGHTFTPPYEETRMLWKTKREPLSAQDDDCISYIFNLISHD